MSLEASPDDAALKKEYEELLQSLENYDSSKSPLGPIPEELQELMANVKRAKGQQAAPQQATQELTPQPGFVIKTADSEQRKVFINVCHSDKVPAPSCWADGMAPEKVLQALEDLQQNSPNADAEAMRFAISVSELQVDTDKQGQPCVTVDCMINSDVMKALQQSRPLKAFVNELVVDYVSKKHSLQLDPKYKLPKMTYKGAEIRSQRIKLDPRPLVSDVTTMRDNEPSFPLVTSQAAAAAKKAKAKSSTSTASAASSSLAGAAATPVPAAAPTDTSSAWQHEVKCEGRPVTQMVVSLQLPAPPGSSNCWTSDSVQVQLCGTKLRVQLEQQQQQQQRRVQHAGHQPDGPTSVCIHLPFAASSDGAEAELQPGTQQVVVRLPYLPLQRWIEDRERQAPHAFSQLPVRHEAYMELDM